MRFQIYSGETRIGQSELDRLDPPMGIASGDFLPTEDYKDVQSVFRLYIEATINTNDPPLLARYYRERDALQLTVRLPQGQVIPLQCVHIEDFSAELEEITITVAAYDSHTFSHYFEQETMC